MRRWWLLARLVAPWERVAPTWMDPNGAVNLFSLRAVQRWYLDRGDMTAEADLDRVVDATFVDSAVRQLGRYPLH